MQGRGRRRRRRTGDNTISQQGYKGADDTNRQEYEGAQVELLHLGWFFHIHLGLFDLLVTGFGFNACCCQIDFLMQGRDLESATSKIPTNDGAGFPIAID